MMKNTNLNNVSVEIDFMYSFGAKMKLLKEKIENLSEKYQVPLKVNFQFHEHHKAATSNPYEMNLNIKKMNDFDWTSEGMDLLLRMLFFDTHLFLDDVRKRPSERFLHVKNYNDFVDFIEKFGLPKFISFDHDLGEGNTGFDCAKFLVDYCLDNDIEKINFHVHSQNPVGMENIEKLLGEF